MPYKLTEFWKDHQSQFLPYHSYDMSAFSQLRKWQTMPSVGAAKQFLHETAADTRKLNLIMRSSSEWIGKSGLKDREDIHISRNQRGITFNPDLKTNAGRAGLKFKAFLEA